MQDEPEKEIIKLALQCIDFHEIFSNFINGKEAKQFGDRATVSVIISYLQSICEVQDDPEKALKQIINCLQEKRHE